MYRIILSSLLFTFVFFPELARGETPTAPTFQTFRVGLVTTLTGAAADYGNESAIAFAGPAYEFAYLVGRLFNRQAPVLPEQVISRFASVGTGEGSASGPYRFIDSPLVGKYFQFPLVVKRIEGKRFAVVE